MTKYNWDERHIITFPEKKLALETKDLHVYYGQKEAINGIDMQFEKNKITALIGPSGCGKSTFLRSLNRMPRLLDKSFMKELMSMQVISMFMKCANTLEWSFNVQTHLPSLSIKTSPLPMNVMV